MNISGAGAARHDGESGDSARGLVGLALDATTSLSALAETLVGMTQCKDIDRLTEALARALVDHAGAHTIGVYRVHQGTGGREAVLTTHFRGGQGSPMLCLAHDAEPRTLPAVQFFEEALDTAGDGLDGGRLIVPVAGAGQVEQWLRIEWPEGAARHSVAGYLLRAYQNLFHLLFDGNRDILTGLLNRRSLVDRLARAIHQSAAAKRRQRSNPGGCVAVLDIDHFKRVNDEFGHLIGDEVLLVFSRLLRDRLREDDELFRFGGEEFVVILAGVDTGLAMTVLERIRLAVAACAFPQVGRVTVSIGLTAIDAGTMPSSLLHRADQALYYAKQHGRNAVAVYEDLLERGAITARETGNDVEFF